MTDGEGFSLTLNQPNSGTLHLDQPSGWRPSSRLGGSPGYGDGPDDPRPHDLAIQVLTSRHVTLQWTPPVQAASQIQDYRVYHDDRLLTTLQNTSFIDATVAPEGIYSYQVSTVDTSGAESLSNPSTVTIERVGGDLFFEPGVERGSVDLNSVS